MPLRVVVCEEPTIFSFLNNVVKEDRVISHTSIEECKARRSNSLVLGKINKVISFSTEAERYIILVKELLPNHEYGGKFKAVVEGSLAKELAHFSPQTGDRLAFLEPFIFLNPAYEPEKSIGSKKQPKYLLHNKYGDAALMWFAKKQEMGGKSDDDKFVKQAKNPEKAIQRIVSAASKQGTNGALPGRSTISQSDGKSIKQNADVVESVRQKPLIKLPQKPQIPVDTKRLNPHYNYKTISSIKSIDFSKSKEQSVNLFGVVNEIMKPMVITNKSKYTLVCMLVDDSDADSGKIKFHFFTAEDSILKQIGVGDILRLHRVKLELYQNEIDGRVFFSHDIVIFKNDCPDIRPISNAKNLMITDDEKRRVESLKQWYPKFIGKPVLLSDICKSGKYNIFCKVMFEPKKEENSVKVAVSDGNAITNLHPARPLQRYNKNKEGRNDHLVTDIIAYCNLGAYADLKVGDFVLFRDVMAVLWGNEKFKLEIKSDAFPEIAVDQTPQVDDIERRIDQFWKSVNKKNQDKDKNYCDNSKHEDVSEIVKKTNKNVLPSLLDQETSVQTRQQKNKQNTSPSKNLEKSVPFVGDDKSYLKPNSGILNTKDDSDGKNTESDPGTKSRKQLFTPNYRTDLSDAATDETSEHNLVVSKNKVPDEDVVNPANTSFSDMVEKVKTKYCTKKLPGQQRLSQDEESVVGRSPNRKTCEGNKLPVVMVERLSRRGYNNSKLDTHMKRGLNVSESQEDLEDAETVINNSCQADIFNRSRTGNKRTRLESLSTVEGNQRTKDEDVDHELETRGQKVCSWLFHPNNKMVAYQEDFANDEFDVAVIKQILCCEKDSPDISKYISALCFRIQAFLLEVIPDPSLSPLDLVSGYCHSGCQRMFLFSAMKWIHEDNSSIPLCPECTLIEQEKELQLMLVMELMVMDPNGRHVSVLAVRNHAEQFLNCSVAEFVKDEVIRKSRVQLLIDYTVRNTYRASVTPLLDIGVSPLNSSSPTLLLVKSTLKLPRI